MVTVKKTPNYSVLSHHTILPEFKTKNINRRIDILNTPFDTKSHSTEGINQRHHYTSQTGGDSFKSGPWDTSNAYNDFQKRN